MDGMMKCVKDVLHVHKMLIYSKLCIIQHHWQIRDTFKKYCTLHIRALCTTLIYPALITRQTKYNIYIYIYIFQVLYSTITKHKTAGWSGDKEMKENTLIVHHKNWTICH